MTSAMPSINLVVALFLGLFLTYIYLLPEQVTTIVIMLETFVHWVLKVRFQGDFPPFLVIFRI